MCGVSLAGDTYYYQNPLEVTHRTERWKWHDCPCCPPMFLKLVGALPGYIYATDPGGIDVNLFVGSSAVVDVGGAKVRLKQTTRYPWDGTVTIKLDTDKPAAFDLNLRVPGWCKGESRRDELYMVVGRPVAGAVTVKINGKAIAQPETSRGYVRLQETWKAGDVVEMTLDMPIRRVQACPEVKADVDRVAIMRGPIVYCAESVGNADDLRNLFVEENVAWESEYRPGLLGGVVVVKGTVKGEFREEPRIRGAAGADSVLRQCQPRSCQMDGVAAALSRVGTSGTRPFEGRSCGAVGIPGTLFRPGAGSRGRYAAIGTRGPAGGKQV